MSAKKAIETMTDAAKVLGDILDWHIAATNDDGGDIREFNRNVDRLKGSSVEKEAETYRAVFQETWLADRTFVTITEEQTFRCRNAFAELQNAILRLWTPGGHYDYKTAFLSDAALSAYSLLLNWDMRSDFLEECNCVLTSAR